MEDQEDDYCRVKKDLEEELRGVQAQCCKLEQENGKYAICRGMNRLERSWNKPRIRTRDIRKNPGQRYGSVEAQSLKSELEKTITAAEKYHQQLQQERDGLS